MDKSGLEQIIFADTFSEYTKKGKPSYIFHLLCIEGKMTIHCYHQEFQIRKADYVILPMGIFDIIKVEQPKTCKTLIIGFDRDFYTLDATRSNYDIIGQISLFSNPVMRLRPIDFEYCRTDLLRLKERALNPQHLFKKEMVGALLKAHILDLYNIHALSNERVIISNRPAELMARFIALLMNGEYIKNRSLDHYASLLYITPHYLSDICKELSGQSASLWIDRFLIREVIRLLTQQKLSIEEITRRLNFSSVSYFSRYVKAKLGVSPASYRDSLRIGYLLDER